jgi:hypothetical protein
MEDTVNAQKADHKPGDVAGAAMEFILAILCTVAGALLIWCALQGAGIAPRVIVGGLQYSAYKAVCTLLIGQALLACAWLAFWSGRKDLKGE